MGDKAQGRSPLNFVIPHYQRGYRWGKQEVTELLDDLWAFSKDKESGDFYCLQPIVLLSKDTNTYEVLDGQQRLTTLYLILTFLDAKRREDGYNQELFTLNYQTRKDCEAFLRDKKFIGHRDESNIDYFHICDAYQTIKEWFDDEKHRGGRGKLVPILMDITAKGNRNVRFIWYEVENVSPIDVFIRLNVGKIQLTDAELTKALLLQRDKYDPKEIAFVGRKLYEIATEWDSIEYALQNPGLWYFLSNKSNEKPTHIEFIFDQIADILLTEKQYFDKKPLKHATFLILSEYLQDLIENEEIARIDAVEMIWEMVTGYFEYFNEWFQNRELYHYIGYLVVHNDKIIKSLIEKAKKLSKKQFAGYLKSEIGKIIKINKTREDQEGNKYRVTLDKLNYLNEDQQGNDIPEIHKILLLHNVHTSFLSDKELSRFPFNLYKKTKKKEKWSLEHIHAQNSQSIQKHENQIIWLKDHINSLTNLDIPIFEKLIKRMQSIQKKEEITQEEFDSIVSDVFSAIAREADLDENNLHSISNLCLVDSFTNSKLNNSVFDVKREKIREREIEGHYLPVCTRNVFMKAYTSFPSNNIYWTDDDRDAYVASIERTYNDFVDSIKND